MNGRSSKRVVTPARPVRESRRRSSMVDESRSACSSAAIASSRVSGSSVIVSSSMRNRRPVSAERNWCPASLVKLRSARTSSSILEAVRSRVVARLSSSAIPERGAVTEKSPEPRRSAVWARSRNGPSRRRASAWASSHVAMRPARPRPPSTSKGSRMRCWMASTPVKVRTVETLPSFRIVAEITSESPSGLL